MVECRTGNEITLHHVETEFPAAAEILVGLHTLGDGLDTEHLEHVDQAGNEQLLLRVAGDVVDKIAIELHIFGVFLMQQPQPRVSFAEIIERDLDASVTGLSQGQGGRAVLRDIRFLGDFKA